MKNFKIYFLLFSLLGFFSFSQIPTGYYDGTAGLTGYTLKTKLFNIISTHTDIGYSGLWTCYKTSDLDRYYEKDNTILDMYSEKKQGKDSYEYIPGTNQCSSVNGPEGTCYNREHSFPKVYFGGQKTPMYSDAHFVIPTDYWVNSKRGDFPYGEVGSSTTFISTNGSKVGNSITPGYSGTVFEPVDEFKGDLARMSLYFLTCYEDKLQSFYNLNISGSPLDGSTGQGFQKWYIDLLLKWSKNDPVSQKEIDRNNVVYSQQLNRNPYIDHPEWVQVIWGNLSLESITPSIPTNLSITSVTGDTASLSWTASTDNVSVAYYKIYINGVYVASSTSTNATIFNLTPNTNYTFYVVAVDTSENNSANSNSIQVQTLSTNEINKKIGFYIFPNPVTNGELNISGDNLSKIEDAKIIDFTGKVVQSISKPFANSNKIILRNLPKGVYLLKAGSSTTKFILK